MTIVLWKCFLLAFFASLASGLYEDQAGKFDWRRSYVGRVRYSHIDNHGERVFVTTEENVVASINSVDGTLEWRRVLENNENGRIEALGVSGSGDLVTVSGSGPYVIRGWAPATGILAFEWPLPHVPAWKGMWSIDSGRVYQTRLEGGCVEISAFSLKTGAAVGASPLKGPCFSSQSKCVVERDRLLCVSPGSPGVVSSVRLSDGEVESQPLGAALAEISSLQLIPSAQASPGPSALLTPARGPALALTLHSASLTTFQLSSSCLSPAIYWPSDKPQVLCLLTDNGRYKLELNGETSSEGASIQIEPADSSSLPRGQITSLAVLPNPSSSRPLSHLSLLIVGDDDSLIFAQSDKVKWVREEALGNVITAEMVDLPVSDEEAAIEKEFANKEVDFGLTSGVLGMFLRRLESQASQVVAFTRGLLGLLHQGIEGDSRPSLRRDRFGLHKLILLVTKSAKVFGVESSSGEIVWKKHLEELAPFSVLDKPAAPLYILRTSRHSDLSPVSVLILKHKDSGLSALFTFNPITGQPLYGGVKKLGYRLAQSLPLPREDPEYLKGLILLSEDHRVEVHPPSSLPVALALHPSLFIYTLDPQSGLIEGFNFVTGDRPEEKDKLSVTKVWTVRLSPPIVSVAGKNRDERVHSQGRVLWDRSVLYKYINPHVIAVATYVPDPLHKNVVTVYLIDAVNGGIVFSGAHKRCSPPVYMVNSENWLVYSLFNDKSRRTEVVSLDVYEGKTQRNSTVFTSVDSEPLEGFVERQAYIFPHSVVAMKETITEKGITSKHLLVGVSTGSVLEVPWALLDPHRSASESGREEGVLPYTPDLSLPREAYITYNQTLPRISGIHTSPSALESTSLALVYGLDLFYTRVTPSKAFDVLKDDFEYWLITLVLGGLISAAYISKQLASRKALKHAWK